MKQDGTYDKANSILEIRGLLTKKEQVVKRLKKLQKEKIELTKDDPLRIALCDLFLNAKHNRTRFKLREHVVEEIARLSDNELERYLRYRYSYDIYPAEKIVKKYPPLVQIEPASICNYRCVFCYQTDKRLTNKKSGHMGVMNMELFQKVINQLEGNVEAITIACFTSEVCSWRSQFVSWPAVLPLPPIFKFGMYKKSVLFSLLSARGKAVTRLLMLLI